MFLNTFKQIATVSFYLAILGVSIQAPPVSLQPGESVQITCAQAISIHPINPSEVTIACAGVPVSPTFSPEPTIASTAVPPSETPTVPPSATEHPSATASATATNLPAVTATATATALPVSPSATATMGTGHDALHWHSVDFGHEHGDNPGLSSIVALFGQAGDLWNGSTTANIGVPFETSAIENTMKHPMAKYYTMTRAQKDAAGYPCGREDGDTNETDNGGSPSNCVAAWRILAHGGANLVEALTNNHSAFIEAQVCSRASGYTQCGIIKTGGWIFWGKFQSPFYNQVFERSGGTFNIGGMTMTFKSDAADLAAIQSPNTVFNDWGGEPYWFMNPQFALDGSDTLSYARNNPKAWLFDPRAWLGDQLSSNEVGPSKEFDCAPFPVGSQCGNRLFHIAIRIFDGWNLADKTNINNPVFICTQISPSNCDYNGSYRGMKEVQFWIDPAWDGAAFDTDSRAGYVSMSRWTDRYQRLRPIGACSVISVDCVPLILTGVPVNYASVKLRISAPEKGIDREYDCPQGGCIYFPN